MDARELTRKGKQWPESVSNHTASVAAPSKDFGLRFQSFCRVDAPGTAFDFRTHTA